MELPLLPSTVPERADAARNRERILSAAQALFAERGVAHVSMDDIARASGVGAGTIYRRFGDRAGLALALLDERARAFQDELLLGPPPLGPGAPPRERLHAFGRRQIELLEHDADLLCVADAESTGGGPFAVYRAHVRMLLAEARPDLDADYAVETLLAAISPRHHRLLRQVRGWDLARLQDGWCALVDAWLGSRAPARRAS